MPGAAKIMLQGRFCFPNIWLPSSMSNDKDSKFWYVPYHKISRFIVHNYTTFSYFILKASPNSDFTIMFLQNFCKCPSLSVVSISSNRICKYEIYHYFLKPFSEYVYNKNKKWQPILIILCRIFLLSVLPKHSNYAYLSL